MIRGLFGLLTDLLNVWSLDACPLQLFPTVESFARVLAGVTKELT